MARQTIDQLVAQLSDKSGMAREQARHTLMLLGENAVPPLQRLLQSSDGRLRWEAAKALSELVEPSSLPALLPLLSEDDSQLRWLAAIGLINLGPRSVGPVLEVLMRDPDSKQLRDGAHHVFHDLSAKSKVLRSILAPVNSSISANEPAGVLQTKARVALNELQDLQAAALG